MLCAAHTKDPAAKGITPPGLMSAPLTGAQPSTASAVGAFKAAIEHSRAHFPLIVALEQGAAAILVAPAIAGLACRTVEDDAIALDAVDIGAAQRVVDTAALRIGPGEDDAVAGDLVDRADMLVVVADYIHMLADLAEQAALGLAALAPAAEVAFELRLTFATVIVIVAVELAQLPVAPRSVMGVVLTRTVGPVARGGPAGAPIIFARRRLVEAAARIIAGQGTIVPAAFAEAIVIAAAP